MQIVPFLTHYQLVYTNFDFSSFSRISCPITVARLAFNCGSFANSKGQNGKSERLSQGSKSRVPIWVESFRGSVFVKVIKVFTDLTPFKLQMSLVQNPVPAR